MVKMHSQQPKRNYYNVYTKIGRDLQTTWSRFKSLMVVFGQKWQFLYIWLLWCMWNLSNFPLNVLSVPFRLIGIHFDHCKNKIQIFNFCLFHRLYRGSVFNFFLRAYLFKSGQVEHFMTMANLKLEPSLFTPRPNTHPGSSDRLHRSDIMRYRCGYCKME